MTLKWITPFRVYTTKGRDTITIRCTLSKIRISLSRSIGLGSSTWKIRRDRPLFPNIIKRMRYRRFRLATNIQPKRWYTIRNKRWMWTSSSNRNPQVLINQNLLAKRGLNKSMKKTRMQLMIELLILRLQKRTGVQTYWLKRISRSIKFEAYHHQKYK